MTLKTEIKGQIQEYEIHPSERIGQHMLVDEEALNIFTDLIMYGANVLEVGSGSGNITERAAARAKKVIGIEIDRRFRPLLDHVQEVCGNVDIVYDDVLNINLDSLFKQYPKDTEWQIASNLPFHISEPFLSQIINIPIQSAVLIVGEQLTRKMFAEDLDDLDFSKTSLLTQTFFDPSLVAFLGKSSFYPQPRTNSSIVVLNPRDRKELANNPLLSSVSNLFLSERGNSTVAHVLMNSLNSVDNRGQTLSKPESNPRSRRNDRNLLRQLARDWDVSDSSRQYALKRLSGNNISRLNIPQSILSRPFSRLNNHDIRILVKSLREHYGH